jgi:hypothetical protein
VSICGFYDIGNNIHSWSRAPQKVAHSTFLFYISLLFILLDDIPLAMDAKKDPSDLKVGGSHEPLRIITLPPLASNLKTWVEKVHDFEYLYETKDKKREIDGLKTLSQEKLEMIWFNSTFTVPKFGEIDAECVKRNDKIREWGGCPLIPAYPMPGNPDGKISCVHFFYLKKKFFEGFFFVGKERKGNDDHKQAIRLRGMRIDNPATMYIWVI